MHLTRLKIDIAKIFLEYMQDAMPLKIQKIHILNANTVFKKVLAVAKMFMHSEMMKLVRLLVLSNVFIKGCYRYFHTRQA